MVNTSGRISRRPSSSKYASVTVVGVTLKAGQRGSLARAQRLLDQRVERIEHFVEFIEIPGVPLEAFAMAVRIRSEPPGVAGEWRMDVFDTDFTECRCKRRFREPGLVTPRCFPDINQHFDAFITCNRDEFFQRSLLITDRENEISHGANRNEGKRDGRFCRSLQSARFASALAIPCFAAGPLPEQSCPCS